MNYLRTTLLLGLLTGLLLVVGKAIGGHSGMIFAFILAIIMNFSAYWFSDKIVLATYNAKQINEQQAPELYSIVKNLAARDQIPVPKVYIVESETPNAFATGRNPQHAAVAATTGILNLLTRDELEGVLAHELAHVKNRDTLTSAIAATIAGAIAMLANMAQWGMIFGNHRDEEHGSSGVVGSILMMILAPIAATLIQLAVSRSREFAADESGAKLCGKPLALASALKKLETYNQQAPMPAAQEHPSTAHLFIINPISGQLAKNLFSTHPSTTERIKRLEAMAYKH